MNIQDIIDKFPENDDLMDSKRAEAIAALIAVQPAERPPEEKQRLAAEALFVIQSDKTMDRLRYSACGMIHKGEEQEKTFL